MIALPKPMFSFCYNKPQTPLITNFPPLCKMKSSVKIHGKFCIVSPKVQLISSKRLDFMNLGKKTDFIAFISSPKFCILISKVLYYCTTSFNKTWTQLLDRLKSCSRCVEDSRWWGSLAIFPTGNKAKCLSLVKHTTKTIHLHLHHKINDF